MTKKPIWMFWDQGWAVAPELVQLCRRSWEVMNPDYEVHCLDRTSLLALEAFPARIDLRRRDLNVQKIAALGRLALLEKFGGVWADATVFCMQPLEQWLRVNATQPFFAFREPGRDRMMSNWFIAAQPESRLLRELNLALVNFYAHTYFWNQNTRLGRWLLDHYSKRWRADYDSTLNWHSWYARKILRVYPYFIFHYTFNKLIITDTECAAEWARAEALPAGPPHKLQQHARRAKGVARAMQELERGETPVYKLDWRVDAHNDYWSAVLGRLQARL